MNSFLLRFLKFIWVPLIIFSIPFYIIEFSGEGASLKEAIYKQEQDSSLLIAYAFSYIDPYLKAEKAKRVKSDILILGTSRTMQFRSFFFNPAYSFYNAGGGITHIHELYNFLICTQVKPQLLIIGLDQYFFNPYWKNINILSTNYEYKSSLITVLLRNMLKIYKRLIKGEIKLSSLNDNRNIGFLARTKGDGFRIDGSYFYNQIINCPYSSKDYMFHNTYANIKEGSHRFEYSDSIDCNSIKVLNKLLSYCHNHSIKVVAYLPPYAPSVMKYMNRTGMYSYLYQIYPALLPLFKHYDYSLFDFSDGNIIGSMDTEFLDGFHGSEKTYLRMLIEMTKQDNTLLPYLQDTVKLKQLILETDHIR